MCHIENEIMKNLEIKPSFYGRYIDDCFVLVRSEEHLLELKNSFISHSVLNFTHEVGVDDKSPFLDVLLKMENNAFITSVYTKPTKTEECMRYESEAPERYKFGILNTLMHRARKICNTEEGYQAEKRRIKSLLVNNGFPNEEIDKI